MSQIEFDEKMARALDVLYGTRDVLRRRSLVHDALAAAPGSGYSMLDAVQGFTWPSFSSGLAPMGMSRGSTQAPDAGHRG